MDNFEIIWLVGLAVWALVSRWARARKKAPARPAPQATDSGSPRVAQSLRDLLREIQRGVGALVEEPSEPVEPRRSFPEPVEPPPINPLSPSPVVVVSKARRRRRSRLTQDLLEDLGSGSKSLARAMVLREVLGPPVALRDRGSEPRRG